MAEGGGIGPLSRRGDFRFIRPVLAPARRPPLNTRMHRLFGLDMWRDVAKMSSTTSTSHPQVLGAIVSSDCLFSLLLRPSVAVIVASILVLVKPFCGLNGDCVLKSVSLKPALTSALLVMSQT